MRENARGALPDGPFDARKCAFRAAGTQACFPMKPANRDSIRTTPRTYPPCPTRRCSLATTLPPSRGRWRPIRRATSRAAILPPPSCGRRFRPSRRDGWDCACIRARLGSRACRGSCSTSRIGRPGIGCAATPRRRCLATTTPTRPLSHSSPRKNHRRPPEKSRWPGFSPATASSTPPARWPASYGARKTSTKQSKACCARSSRIS